MAAENGHATFPLRDCQAWRSEGMSLNTVSNTAAKWFDLTVRQYVSWKEDDACGGIQGSCAKMLEADANFVMGKVLTLGMEVLSTGHSRRVDTGFAAELDELAKKQVVLAASLSERESMHVRAVLLWSEGYQKQACDIWEKILLDHPRDLLALKFAYDSYFFLGDSRQIRDCVARVMPNWNKGVPLFSFLKGMYAFGLEETNLYPLAEKEAAEALSMNRQDAWAAHAIAHVCEMENRVDYGIRFLEGTESDWSGCKLLACHNYWHLCLYYIEKGDYNKVLHILDNAIAPMTKSDVMLDIVDLVSLLYRLKLEHVPLSRERWELARALCQKHMDDHVIAFNDVHFMLAFCGAGRQDLAQTLLDSMQHIRKQPQSCSQNVIAKYGCKVAGAVAAFESGDYDKAADLLYPIRLKLCKIGGSHAQRDVFEQVLIQSALLSKSKHGAAKILLNERKMQKPGSQVTERLIQRFLSQHTNGYSH